MYLRKITLQGFKSFARKTVLDFGPGITTIVGPNGSGKSNVSDAVKWVLGEQSMKNLRSKKSEDVIFVGSGIKSKAGMAEVSLELDNRQKIVPIDYTDLIITRRIFRSGESEYLLNGSKVRLLDLTEILSKSGFGRSTYTVISQGMVDKLITQTPEERRELFEDASGVKHFYIKKEQALKKFKETKENLLRVSDIVRELKPRLENLERQREELKERSVLSSKLKELQKKYYGGELRDLKEKLEENEKKYSETLKEIKTIEEEVSLITQKFEERQQKSSQLEEEKKEQEIEKINEELQELQEALLEEIKNNSLAQEKQNLFKERLPFLEKELESIKVKIEEKLNENKNAQKSKEALEKELRKTFRLLETKGKNQEKLSTKEIIFRIKNSLEKLLLNLTSKFLENAKDEIKGLIKFLKGQEQLSGVLEEELKARTEKIKLEIESLKSRINSNLEILKIYKEKEETLENEINEGTRFKSLIKEGSEKETKEAEIRKLKEKREKARRELLELRGKNKASESEFFEIEKVYRGKRDILSEFKEELTKVEIELARLKTKKEDLEKEIKENVGLAEIKEVTLITGDQKDKILEEISNLKKSLERLGGAVVYLDEGEYQEVKKRYEFLESQSEDLKNALGGTKKIVLELEKKIHDQFREKFEKISQKFDFYFQKLFGGGTAKLILKEGDTEEERIIDIMAVPPGKRVHTLNTLSGGEKSLISVALLFAIFSVNPTPFCILDEVDAALDESNSSRFAELLATLSGKTQFILITHNRETMKQAKVLYGVTMDETKVSKVLSLKLEEAEKYSESKNFASIEN